MQPFTTTLQLAGRTITVHALNMTECIHMMLAEEIAAREADANPQPVAEESPARVMSGDLEALATAVLKNWLIEYLLERKVSIQYVSAMSTVTEADLLLMKFREIDTLIAKIKVVNEPFFVKFQGHVSALEHTSEASPDQRQISHQAAHAPAPPPTSASALNDPLLHSLEQAIQAHGATATSSSNPHSTNSSTA